MKHEGSARPEAGELSDEQEALLVRFESLLLERAVPGGLVSRADAPRLRERHVHDSLRAVQAVHQQDRSAYDLGSGAGLPGIVIAIACPQLEVTLVETRRSRAAFLELTIAELGLPNAHLRAGRVESLSGEVDLCVARAFAPPAAAWLLAEPLLVASGRLIYFAGKGFEPARDLPAGISVTLLPPSLAPSGPLVIMSRQ